MTLDELNRLVRRAPDGAWNRRTLDEMEEAIMAIDEYLKSLPVGAVLKTGSLSSTRYDPWTVTKVNEKKYAGFSAYDYGISSIGMAETIFHNCKATGYPIKLVKEA